MAVPAPVPRRMPSRADVTVAVVIAVLQVAGSPPANSHQPLTVPLDAFAYGLLVTGPVVLLLRRSYPTTVLLIVFAATATYTIRGYGYGPVFLSLIAAFLTAGTIGSRWRSYPLLGVGYVYFGWVAPAVAGTGT
ncbi:histidine kinase, partial [Rhodococcus sp. CC-R104]|nr:histidine kinase [Rhodococcus sp. CC-R104]